jgi:hypothetical protein
MRAARTWAIVASGLLVAAAVTAVAFYSYVQSAERRRWDEMRQWCEKTAREVRARDPRRPVLRGQPLEGNAWDDYQAAFAAIAPAKDLREASDLLYDSPKADAARVRALVQQHASALQLLRRGASRSTARRDVDWENSSNDSFIISDRLVSLAVCHARFLFEEGRIREAMEALLDAGQFAEDSARDGTDTDGLLGLALLAYVQNAGMRFLTSGRLGREDCREMARDFEVLDRGFPREADGYALSPMTSGFKYLRMDSINGILESIGITKHDAAPTWRFGFSERLVLVDAFQTELDESRLLMEAAGKPWREAQRIEKNIEVRFSGAKNPLLREYWGIKETLSNKPQPPPQSLFRERLAQLRLLRTAAHFRATGEVLVLDDPYGDKIRSRVTESHLKVWSVGADDRDDGGTGVWDARKGKDIVLELQRGATQEK